MSALLKMQATKPFCTSARPSRFLPFLQCAEVEDELRKCRRRLAESEADADDMRARLQLMEIAHEEKINEEKAKIVQILEAGFNERQKLGMSAILFASA
jgi:hypothetical protein